MGNAGWGTGVEREKKINLNNCMVLQEGTHFRSNVTGERFRIKQEINCRSKNIIYVVKCRACGKQGQVEQQLFRVEYLTTYRISVRRSLLVAQLNTFMKHQITRFRTSGSWECTT